MGEGEDFLAIDSIEQREAARAAGLEIASLYLVFKTDARARQLLEMWDVSMCRKRTSPSATHAEFAYAEAQRAFVEGIKEQIRIAESAGARM